MSKNIHTEKDSHGSRPNKKNLNDGWVEEGFKINPDITPSHRVKKKPSKQMKKKK
jgi:hypothetical protein